jgi:hypothetical protein
MKRPLIVLRENRIPPIPGPVLTTLDNSLINGSFVSTRTTELK